MVEKKLNILNGWEKVKQELCFLLLSVSAALAESPKTLRINNPDSKTSERESQHWDMPCALAVLQWEFLSSRSTTVQSLSQVIKNNVYCSHFLTIHCCWCSSTVTEPHLVAGLEQVREPYFSILKCVFTAVIDLWLSNNWNHCGLRSSLVMFKKQKVQNKLLYRAIYFVSSSKKLHTQNDLSLLAKRPAVFILLVIYILLRVSAAAG